MAVGTETGVDRQRRFWRMAPWMVAALILLLLLGACGLYEAAARTTGDLARRAACGIALVAAVLLVWINLAVGIVGSEDNPANLMFGAVLATGIVGALAARFRPRGMARALAATALAQTLVGMIALIAGWGATGENGPWPLMALT